MIDHQTDYGNGQQMRVIAWGELTAEREERGEKLMKNLVRQQLQAPVISRQYFPLDQLVEIRIVMNEPAKSPGKLFQPMLGGASAPRATDKVSALLAKAWDMAAM